MAVLPPSATFEEFRDYVTASRGAQTDLEMQDLWEWRQKLLGLSVSTGVGRRSMLPADEQDMTKRQRENKIVSEAKAAGRSIEKVSKSCWS